MVIAPCSRMGPVTEDERNGLINHSPVYGKYEDDVDRESAYEMLQKGVQASTEQQNNPAVKGKEVAVDDGILGGLKDILFGTTGPRGGKKDGVVQTMAKSAARQVTNQIVRGVLGSLLGGEKVSQALFVFSHTNLLLPDALRLSGLRHFANNNKGSFSSLYSFIKLRFSH